MNQPLWKFEAIVSIFLKSLVLFGHFHCLILENLEARKEQDRKDHAHYFEIDS